MYHGPLVVTDGPALAATGTATVAGATLFGIPAWMVVTFSVIVLVMMIVALAQHFTRYAFEPVLVGDKYKWKFTKNGIPVDKK